MRFARDGWNWIYIGLGDAGETCIVGKSLRADFVYVMKFQNTCLTVDEIQRWTETRVGSSGEHRGTALRGFCSGGWAMI